ncbi:MAG TPA: hypothetical protein VMU95_25455 [Trebonia sp.]|nr:hypothetical protein [Trebonia sp.]
MVKRLVVFVVVAVVVAGTAQAGLWWVPFLAGVAAGLLPPERGWRVVLAAAAGAAAGWGLPLWILSLRGYPAGATARVIAALAGIPPYAALTVTVALLLAFLLAVTGAWLVRAVVPRRYRPS